MVYESDFYTTRRPYTRPISSHYSVTNPGAIIRPISPLPQQQALNKLPHIIPYVAHKRLVNVIHTPYPLVYYTHEVPLPIRIYSRVRPSVIAAELCRIRNLPRSSNVSYVSRYLNSKDNTLFDDETREIRARADSLLRKIHVYVPRPTSSDYAEVIVPERMRSDDYIRRVLTARKNAKKDDEEEQRHFGSGNLACVAYTGGKPHSRRRPYYKVADLRAADVQSDVNLLSYYAKNRQAAASAYPDSPLTERELRKARALAEDRAYATPRKASPDPEPIIKPVRESKIIVDSQCEKIQEPISEPLKKRKSISKKNKKYDTKIIAETNGFNNDESDIFKVNNHHVDETEVPVLEINKFIEPDVVLETKEIVKNEPEIVAEQFIKAKTPELIAEIEKFTQPEAELSQEIEEKDTDQLVEQEISYCKESVPVEELELQEKLPAEEKALDEICDEKFEAIETPNDDFEPELESKEVIEKDFVWETNDDVEQDVFVDETKKQIIPDDYDDIENEETDELKTVIQSETLPVDLQQNEDPVDSENDYQQNEDVQGNDDDDDDVLQRKLDEEEMRRQVEEFKRQAEEEKRRQAEEARLAEERWKAEIEERKRLEEEARQARFREIEEQERLEAERQKEEARLEAERLRDQQIAEEQRRAAEFEAAVALEEEERYIIEKATEKARLYQEIEEKLASEVAMSSLEEPAAPDSTSDECHCHDNVKSQDREERPDSPDADDDTQIEEEAACVWTDHEDVSEHNVYDGEHEGFNSCQELDKPIENTLEIVETSSDDDDD